MPSINTPMPKTAGSEGIFYVVPFPMDWCQMPVRFDQHPELGHPDFWEADILKFLVKDWHLETYEEYPTRELLHAALLPLAYACPRGRVAKVGKRFKVYHGNDLKPFMKASRRDIEWEFGIVGQASWEFDDHERCQQLDKDEFRRMLGIKKDWDAV